MPLSDWSNFFVATASASATLTGLIFVGVSINLVRILAGSGLPERALNSLVLLLTILTLSIIFLIPGQSPHSQGFEVLGIGLVAWSMIVFVESRKIKAVEAPYKRYFIFNMALNQITLLPYFVCDFCILSNPSDVSPGANALHWMALAFVLSFIKGVMDAWILLVEINR